MNTKSSMVRETAPGHVEKEEHMQIVSREHIKAKARAAFKRGDGRDSHGMNWNAPALKDWLAEYDRVAMVSMVEKSNRRAA